MPSRTGPLFTTGRAIVACCFASGSVAAIIAAVTGFALATLSSSNASRAPREHRARRTATGGPAAAAVALLLEARFAGGMR